MPLELRPDWCLTDEAISEVLDLGEWMTDEGGHALESDGDDWRPGDGLALTRHMQLKTGRIELRRSLDLAAGQVLGVAARWSCRATATAGTHADGPSPIPLLDDVTVTLDIPAEIGDSIEVETCLVVNWTADERPVGACPDGALVWSDGWSIPTRNRTILLEGDEARIPVRTVSFDNYFGQPSGALWAVDLDTSIEMDDRLSNVITVLLNRDVLRRDFSGSDGEPEPARLPAAALAGISVDLVRSLTAALIEDLAAGEDWSDLADGSIGAMLTSRLSEAFGSVSRALSAYERDQPAFSRELWHRFAPDSWSVGR